MILALDVGNSNIYGGVLNSNGEILIRFRKNSKQDFSTDEIGIFFVSVLRENGIDPTLIKNVVISSVVPSLIHPLRGASQQYFKVNPFIITSGVKTKLKIKYKNPQEVGADRIANAIAGFNLFPNKNLVIIDLGTATTFCAISEERDYLGGVIIPGIKIAMESLTKNTAKLSTVEIVSCENIVARSTSESIQSGLYHGHLEAMRGITKKIIEENFKDKEVLIVGTGGFARLFEKENFFNVIDFDLVLKGMKFALELNS